MYLVNHHKWRACCADQGAIYSALEFGRRRTVASESLVADRPNACLELRQGVLEARRAPPILQTHLKCPSPALAGASGIRPFGEQRLRGGRPDVRSTAAMNGNDSTVDPARLRHVHSSFERHPFMQTIGASLDVLGPGRCRVKVPWRSDLTQQHGYLHAGVIASLADTASGYALFTLVDGEDTSLITVEFKFNFLAPAQGSRA